MKTFEAVFPNGRTLSYQIRGVCQFDTLNPCWDARPDDTPGKHWGGGAACAACIAEAASDVAKGKAMAKERREALAAFDREYMQ